MTSPADTREATSPFWRFSLKFYAVPGVAPACIALQDDAGVDVNLLFFLLWNATQGRALNVDDVKELNATIGIWREATVIPLRAIRRAMKTGPSILAPEATEAFRTRIKQIELEAERLQQEAMYAMAQTSRYTASGLGPTEAARISIASYQSVLRAFPRAPLDVILSAFAKTAANG
jgi:uncharacterized protein (TIGR02444 family)